MKRELQSENGELRRQKAISDKIFHALRSGWQVSKILQLLTDQESLALIAKIAADVPSIECSTGSLLTGSSISTPSQDSSATDEELLMQKYEIEDSSQSQTETTAQTCPWIATAHDEILTRHLFSVYWTFLHPSYRLFSMEQFLQGYETGNQEDSGYRDAQEGFHRRGGVSGGLGRSECEDLAGGFARYADCARSRGGV